MANTAIRDLTLLSDILPIEERKEIFNYNNIHPLMTSITKTQLNREEHSVEFPNIDLVFSLIGQGILLLKFKYELMNKGSPNLSQITIEHLERTVGICYDIANITRNEELQKGAKDNKQVYLFDWDNIVRENRYHNFLYKIYRKN